MAVLAILMISVMNPSPYIDSRTIVDEPFEAQETPFLTAADGDESSQSLTVFSETTDDDVLFYPDAFVNETEHVADSGDDDFADSWAKDSTYWSASDSNETAYFIHSDSTLQVEGFEYSFWAVGVEMKKLMLWDGSEWQVLVYLGAGEWHNGTNYGNVLTGNNVTLAIERYVDCDYLAIRWIYMTLADSEHYAESFADVSDLGVYGDDGGGEPSISSDGDVGSIEASNKGTDDDYDGYNYNISTFGVGDCLEIRYKINDTTIDKIYVFLWAGESVTGDRQIITLDESTSWTTTKYPLTTTANYLTVTLKSDIGQGPFKFDNDYLRIGDSTEMGWQHDCSTTAGVTDGGEVNNTYSISSDSDILTLTCTRDAGATSAYSNFYIALDTTATSIDLESSDYPFVEVSANVSTSASTYVIQANWDSKYANMIPTKDTELTISRGNVLAGGTAYFARIRFYAFLAAGWSVTWNVDYVKAYSIANNSITQSGVGTDDYLYTDSGVLYSHVDDGYIELNHDPALSVSDTYSVYNLTTSGTAPEFSQYVSEWSTYSDNTRGATTSGTVTDIKLKFDSTEVLSAIKFIEDSTAPDADIVVSPDPPDDDEQVTLSSIVFDDVEVWKVWYNAISYPSGFSDEDYEATEEQENYWSYSFSSLIAGDYCFKVIANDGANNNTITQSNRDYATTRFTVRESTIVVEEITLIGAGSDFTMMQFSARINKDCSYVIYEESENNAEAATHSGSVSEPSFNLAWTKLSTTDTNVNFTIKFTNDTLTYNYTSQYQVAQTVLSVTSYDWGLSETQVTLSYQTSKSGTYTLYLDDVQDSTSSFASGSNFLNWSRPSAVDPAEIDAAVKLTDGTTTIWLNQTYSEYSLTAFSIQTLFMDLTDPSISAIFTTSWGNATGYLYEADVQKATESEGTTLSYTKSTTAGTYNVALKIDAGGEIAWYNTTYTVAVTTLQVTDDSIRTTENYAYLSGHVNLNANYTVYEETVQVGTGSVGEGSFEIRWTKASSSVENVTVLFKSDSQTYPVYSGYDVAAQVTFVVESWWISLQIGLESYVEFYAHTSWENATIYVYDNTTLMNTVSELAGGASSNFWMSEVQGLHTITLNITHGATVHTRTKTYFIPDWAVSGLSLRWSIYTFQDNYTMLSLESNWRNCSYSVYLNGSEVATSANDPVTLNFTRAINIGTYNLTIYADGGTQTYTIKNIRYVITEEGVSYDFSSVVGGRSVREGDVYIYEGDDVVINENPPGIYITAETAATIAVSTVFIFFLAVLFTNYRFKKAQLARDKKETQ